METWLCLHLRYCDGRSEEFGVADKGAHEIGGWIRFKLDDGGLGRATSQGLEWFTTTERPIARLEKRQKP